MKTASKVQANGQTEAQTTAAVETVPANEKAVDTKEQIRYLEGRPKQYRADAKGGNFNINGGTPIGDTLSFVPLAWRFFEDDILQMGKKKWVELFFIDDKNCVSAILFHGYSREHLEKLAQDLFYEDVTLSDVVISVRFVPKKNEKIKPAATYHIAEFEIEEVVSPEKVKELHAFAQANKIYRTETLTDTCELQAYHNYHFPQNYMQLAIEPA
jgi:hypothetical protein